VGVDKQGRKHIPEFEGERTMAISMLDQMLFPLSCKHAVVLGRLENKPNWTCEECGQETDLSSGPFRDLLKKDLDTAHQIDLLEKAKGRTVERLG
jgi:hypothetical protein